MEPPFLLLQHKSILDSEANTFVVLCLYPLLHEAVQDSPSGQLLVRGWFSTVDFLGSGTSKVHVRISGFSFGEHPLVFSGYSSCGHHGPDTSYF